jgi:outer membrane protein TolC
VEKRSEAEAEAAQDRIADEVWRSYSDAKTALRQRTAARTLLQAAETSYEAATEAYKLGVRNVLDVLSAQRLLAQARSSDITASSRVLTSFADLAYRTADLLRTQTAKQP